jgi:hypothetical protein
VFRVTIWEIIVSLYLLEIIKDQVRTTKQLETENSTLQRRVEAMEEMLKKLCTEQKGGV